ncbi:MAG: phosphate ABC transporter permease subunit PstC [Bacteroidetes bacterium]|nr:phosphate ABC transporter permease subunit PstC [Bacteroidota bacterium]
MNKRNKEKIIELVLAGCAFLTILTTGGILYVLLFEAIKFFSVVSIVDFLTDTQWTPLFADKHFGIMSLLSGTLLTSFIAIMVALPTGLTIALYLNEYSSRRFKNIIKPILEILASVPTVVYGFFALTVVTPFLQTIFPDMSGFNSLSAGFVMGIMIIPYVSSLSDDAIAAVPRYIREGSLALGANRFQTAFRVIIPSASSGIIVSAILAISRAIGETMIVAIAAGQQPRLTFNPMVPVETITTYIVKVSLGDVSHNSLEYQTIFAAGITLFVFTFLLNNLSYWLNKKFEKKYV